jgi:predicted alpha/beta-hydrolase family hydrolase
MGGPTLLLTHGSGSPMDSPFMNEMTRLIVDLGIGVIRFEFDYMAERRRSGKKRPPPRGELLIDEYKSAVEQCGANRPFIGGKSLGARVASMCAADLYAEDRIAGLVCLGYPFHPVGKPDNLRTAHLKSIKFPALIAQGENDPFGTQADVVGYDISANIGFHWAPAGNHDLAPPKRSGRTAEENWSDAAHSIAAFMKGA